MTKLADQLLKEQLEDHARRSGFPKTDLGKGLESYAAFLFVQEAGFEELLGGVDAASYDLTAHILRTDDLGVDIVIEDENSKQIIIAQCAYRNPKTGFPEDKASAFFSSLRRLATPDYVAKGGEQAQELLASLHQKLRDGFTLGMRFVTNLEVPADHRVRIQAATWQKTYEDDGFSVLCDLIDRSAIAELAKQIEAQAAGILENVELQLQDGEFIHISTPRQTLVARLRGSELQRIYKKYGALLFARNIRQPMAADRGINREIRDSADGTPDDFFFYNNGVSAICSRLELDGTTVAADRFQVINGAQTIGSLSKSKSSDRVFVLFRLTATDELAGGTFTDQVIKFNNTQNPVKVSDFRANDPIQTFIKGAFNNWSGHGPVPALRYQPKRGSKPDGRKVLSSEEFARIRHSFLHGPIESFRAPKEFWNRDTEGGGRYAEAFGVDGVLLDRWPSDVVRQAVVAVTVHERIKTIAADAKKANQARPEGTPKSAEATYLYRLARYVLALVAVGLKERRALWPDDPSLADENLLARKDAFEEVVAPLIAKSRELLLGEFTSRRTLKHEVQPEYNLARDEDTWQKLKSLMQELVRSDLV